MNFLLLWIMWWIFALSQTRNNCEEQDRHIFFIGRASVQKSDLISKFNISDHPISHVGIGILHLSELRIFHVEDKPDNALSNNSLAEFLGNGEFYYCVYSLPVSAHEENRIRNILYHHAKVKFDTHILLYNDALYCSEFCYLVLNKVAPGKFHLQPVTRFIPDSFTRSFLGRDEITYIPVDFFLEYQGLKLIAEGGDRNQQLPDLPQ